MYKRAQEQFLKQYWESYLGRECLIKVMRKSEVVTLRSYTRLNILIIIS